LNMLSEEWRMQRENLESKLAYSVEQCKTLANSLNNATEDLRKRRLKSLENETRLIKANEDLQWRYETKLQELKDILHATQNDLTTKVCEVYFNCITFDWFCIYYTHKSISFIMCLKVLLYYFIILYIYMRLYVS